MIVDSLQAIAYSDSCCSGCVGRRAKKNSRYHVKEATWPAIGDKAAAVVYCSQKWGVALGAKCV